MWTQIKSDGPAGLFHNWMILYMHLWRRLQRLSSVWTINYINSTCCPLTLLPVEDFRSWKYIKTFEGKHIQFLLSKKHSKKQNKALSKWLKLFWTVTSKYVLLCDWFIRLHAADVLGDVSFLQPWLQSRLRCYTEHEEAALIALWPITFGLHYAAWHKCNWNSLVSILPGYHAPWH